MTDEAVCAPHRAAVASGPCRCAFICSSVGRNPPSAVTESTPIVSVGRVVALRIAAPLAALAQRRAERAGMREDGTVAEVVIFDVLSESRESPLRCAQRFERSRRRAQHGEQTRAGRVRRRLLRSRDGPRDRSRRRVEYVKLTRRGRSRRSG